MKLVRLDFPLAVYCEVAGCASKDAPVHRTRYAEWLDKDSCVHVCTRCKVKLDSIDEAIDLDPPRIVEPHYRYVTGNKK